MVRLWRDHELHRVLRKLQGVGTSGCAFRAGRHVMRANQRVDAVRREGKAIELHAKYAGDEAGQGTHEPIMGHASVS